MVKETLKIADRTLTITKATIMTISFSLEHNPCALAAGFEFVQAEEVGVISIVGRRSELSVPSTDVLRVCMQELSAMMSRWQAVLFGYELFLLTALPCPLPSNVLARRRGIWGARELTWLPKDSTKSPAIEVRRDGECLWLGLCSLPMPVATTAAEYCRTHTNALLFLSKQRELDQARVLSVANKALSRGAPTVDWTSITSHLGAGDDIYVRVFGGFDDLEVSVDVFGRSSLVNLLENL